jgi:hypothetical protein
MRNVSDKSWRQNQNTHSMLNNFFFFIRAVYEMWKNTAEPDRPQIDNMCSMRTAYWIPKAINTCS